MAYDESVHRRRDTGAVEGGGAHRSPGPGNGEPGVGRDDRWADPSAGRWSAVPPERDDRWTEPAGPWHPEAGPPRYGVPTPGPEPRYGVAGPDVEPRDPGRRDRWDQDETTGAGWSALGQISGCPDTPPEAPAAPPQPRIPAAVLDDVFDDPRHGDPGRDRMAVHWLWELLLLLGTVWLAYLIHQRQPAALRPAELGPLLLATTALGLLTLGAGLSLRAGAVNLALGPVAVAAALYFAGQDDREVLATLGPAVLAAIALGLLLALVVVGFHVPAWAASLAAGLAVVGGLEMWSLPAADGPPWYDPEPHAWYLFGGWATLTVLGGIFGSIKTIRRSVGRFRPVADPARRRGGLAALLTATAITVSMVYAVLAGVLLSVPVVEPATAGGIGFGWTGLALGAALLGGTSAFGRRGGVFGTLLAVILLSLLFRWAEGEEMELSRFAVAAAVIGVGLLATRLVESYGRPRSAVDADEDWTDERAEPVGDGWASLRTGPPEAWSAGPPVPPTQRRGDPWDSGQWRIPDD